MLHCGCYGQFWSTLILAITFAIDCHVATLKHIYQPGLTRSVRHRVLALPLPAARVHPREDGDGNDDPADPSGHVRGGQTEYAQSQLRLCSRNDIKHQETETF